MENIEMKTVLTVGVFDLLHYGHIELFRKAKLHGDLLIVAVQESEYVTKFKPNANLVYNTDERLYMVSAIKYVDNVTTYTSIDKIIDKIEFDVFAVGEDQNHDKFKAAIDWCKNNGKEVVCLPRTEGISTSMIKNILKSKIK
ncbi:MAG: adenylyltransferase/cytidyltransferase family protein [Muribaculum sp.]|nr:adenylyltransferase/cytidyltransferase family protein [Muribaculum sp.]